MNLLEELPVVLPGPGVTGFATESIESPFPVEADTTPRADLVKLNGQPVLLEDHAWAQWTDQKRTALVSNKAPLIAPGASGPDLGRWAQWVGDALRQQHPNGPIDHEGRFPWIGGLRPSDPVSFFQALTLSLQEDFVVMALDQAGGVSAQVLSVCFPSGWRPEDKLGQSLMDIHLPVANNAALQRATPAMIQAMTAKGPFVRHVWTLAGDGRLSRGPNEDTLATTNSIDDLWFRCERQVTLPLHGRAALFLIRVLVTPYRQIVSSTQRHTQMVAALRAMSPAMMAYKNISRAADLILKSPYV